MTGVWVGSVLPSTVVGVGIVVETVAGTVDPEEHALNKTRTTRPIPSRNVLVIVAGVIMPRVVVARMVVIGVVVSILAVVVPGMRIERWCSRRRWRSGYRLLVPVRWIVSTGMNRMIVAERDTFEFARRSTNRFGLAKCNVVWGLAFENEIGGLIARQ